MSRPTTMLTWLACACVHFGILFISSLLLQILALGGLELTLGILTWRIYRQIERRAIQRVVDMAESEDQTMYYPASGGLRV